MSKRKRPDNSHQKSLEAAVRTARQGERDTFTPIPTRRVLPPGSASLKAYQLMLDRRQAMLELEDRRRYHPLKVAAPPKTVHGTQIRRVVAPKIDYRKVFLTRIGAERRRTEREFLPYSVMFEQPKEVLVCIRRKVRREVLHALGKTGSGSGRRQRRKPHNRNIWSGVHC